MAGGPDVPAELFRQFLEDLFLENRLNVNELVLGGRRVDLADIIEPVALVLGAEDSYVPRDVSLPFLEAIDSGEARVFDAPVDHVGTFVGPDAHETYWPRLCEWVQEHT